MTNLKTFSELSRRANPGTYFFSQRHQKRPTENFDKLEHLSVTVFPVKP